METFVPPAHDGTLRVLGRSDLATLDLAPADVIEAVTAAVRALADGTSVNPRKLSVQPADQRSVSYAMLGRDGAREVVAIRASYRHDPHHDRTQLRHFTTLTLYDDRTGTPIALMDCGRIGSLRTPAVSAVLARECAPPNSRTALLIGTGTTARQALPMLVTALPELDRLLLFGTSPDGIAAVLREFAAHAPGRSVEVLPDLDALRTAAGEADIVIATAGPATPAAVEADWLKPGALAVLVGYGLAPSTFQQADRIIATSAAQMADTGTDMAFPDGTLRTADAELADVLAGSVPGRGSAEERILAYNSGLVVTDIAVGALLAEVAAAKGLGTTIPLWS
ncbi:ornithine cyclodeaminase family protein [Kitasatospora sp. NPDC004669]|uniref:ornithine cyclodeaminase family protein n=1 Tax=Kitasatospora sp. NPDC004669 TaxID=3154555 RepID=UPI0033A70BE7